MEIWTTFSPKKVCWELTNIQTQGEKATSDWQKHEKLIFDSLELLHLSGIAGIRLCVFPEEITADGKQFDWKAIEKMLDFCKQAKLAVDLCIGPYQYPNYPGIYLPQQLLSNIPESDFLDDNPELKTYGIAFLETQLSRYGKDERIHGFHFANEWPDMQVIDHKEPLKKTASKAFMLEAAKLIKTKTTKPISMNTNIDAADKGKIKKVFGEILNQLGPQGKLGFDIYPSQESWLHTPLQKIRRLIEPYAKSFAWSQKQFPQCEIYFCEVESQPWGDGRSWLNIISTAENSDERILTYSRNSLEKTWRKHIKPTSCARISLWGADFWLSAHELGLMWPLKQIQESSEKAKV